MFDQLFLTYVNKCIQSESNDSSETIYVTLPNENIPILKYFNDFFQGEIPLLCRSWGCPVHGA